MLLFINVTIRIPKKSVNDRSLGVRYVKAEVEGFIYFRDDHPNYPAIHGALSTNEADSLEVRSNIINGVLVIIFVGFLTSINIV
jgi:hypothetical protein